MHTQTYIYIERERDINIKRYKFCRRRDIITSETSVPAINQLNLTKEDDQHAIIENQSRHQTNTLRHDHSSTSMCSCTIAYLNIVVYTY